MKAVINGVGALVTGATVIIIGISKFMEGAWITMLVLPILVLMFQQIRSHYRQVGKGLSLRGLPPSLKPLPSPRVVIPISGVHRGIIDAINFSRAISKDVTAVYVELEPGASEKVRDTWEAWWPDVPLVVVPSPYRSIVGPLLDFLDRTDTEHNDGQLATVILLSSCPPIGGRDYCITRPPGCSRLPCCTAVGSLATSGRLSISPIT